MYKRESPEVNYLDINACVCMRVMPKTHHFLLCECEFGCRASSELKGVDELSKFAYVPSNCRSSLHQREAVPGVKDDSRLNDSVFPE